MTVVTSYTSNYLNLAKHESTIFLKNLLLNSIILLGKIYLNSVILYCFVFLCRYKYNFVK